MLLPNEHLLKIDRAIERMDDRARYARLDRNERITAFPNDVFRDMLSSLTAEHICAYPDPSPLYARLSRTLGVPGNVPIAVEIVSGGSSLLVIHEW